MNNKGVYRTAPATTGLVNIASLRPTEEQEKNNYKECQFLQPAYIARNNSRQAHRRTDNNLDERQL